jgi:hypothetical protein
MQTWARALISCAFAVGLSGRVALAQQQPDAEGLEFFEKRIRPVLIERCYECHSAQAKKLKGKLRLDSREDFTKGGESGAPITPGDPDKSLLIKAIRYADEDLQMPPKQKLAASQIKDIEDWVKRGAPYPASTSAKASTNTLAEAKKFWSFQPPKNYPIPSVKQPGWVRTEIDAFILAKLEQNGLTPGPMADKRTLLRRATFDITGLPPKLEDVQAFETDASPDAFAKVVDRLLASPQYGERWGRYWLDVARYADSKGYVFVEERRYPYSYTYRDWVVRALNEDLPYDQFLIQQIAADQLPLKDDKRPLAAMGFLTLGRRFLNVQADIIDDRIDVVMRGTQAMTVGCARCHDHKFDPIPTRDYYSLYGVFASSEEPADLPLLGNIQENDSYRAFEKDVKAKEEEVSKFLAKRHVELTAKLRSPKQISDYLLAAHEAREMRDNQLPDLVKKHNLSRFVLERWRTSLKKDALPVFAPWRAYAAIADKDFAAKSPAVIGSLKSAQPAINPLVAAEFADKPPQSLRDLADRYGALLAKYDKPEPLPDASEEQLRQAIRGQDAPPSVAIADTEKVFLRDDREKLMELKKKVEAIRVTHPGAPPRAMVLRDGAVVEPHVFVRGNPGNQGDRVPRQFLAILSEEKRQPFKHGSGRLDLAQAIADKNNPLTARVMVNRTWLGHFGFGLVRTPSDFGARGDRPSHPELLDYLACRFMRDGWSMKKLHRLIMLSSVYQQTSDERPSGKAIDPDNHLLWRMNRRRLDLESMRDSLLAASGQLDPTIGGRAVDILAQPYSKRRTIYGYIDRQNLPGLWRSFDFASPDAHSPQRFVTTVPQQALFWMNSPFVIEQAKALVKRPDIASAEGPAKVSRLYQTIYARPATPEELKMALEYVAAEPTAGGMNPWEKYAQALLAANEFVFVD